MSILGMALMIVGALIFVISFLIPSSQEESTEDIRELVDAEVKARMEAEMEGLRGHVDSVVDEAIEYAQEKTERSLERISNEKIMAVNEYSETVLAEINKNHQEVMFLYDMLNDKQKNLKDSVTEADQAARQAKETARQVQETANEAKATVKKTEPAAEFQKLTPEQGTEGKILSNPAISGFQAGNVSGLTAGNVSGLTAGNVSVAEAGNESGVKVRTLDWAKMAEEDARAVGDAGTGNPVEAAGTSAGASSPSAKPHVEKGELHDRILKMHDQGVDSVQIAKQLNMGDGEVDLIIGLHGNH